MRTSPFTIHDSPFTMHRLLPIVLLVAIALMAASVGSAPVRADGAAPFWYKPLMLQAGINSLAAGSGPDTTLLAADGYYGKDLFRSHDHGVTWERLANWNPGDTRFDYKVVTYPSLPHAFIAYSQTAIYKTLNDGDTWTPISLRGVCSIITRLLPHPTDPNIMYMGLDRGFERSLDGGQTWVGGIPSRVGACGWEPIPRSLAASPAAPNVVYASGSSYGTDGLYRSDDYGLTWQQVSAGVPSSPSDPSKLFGVGSLIVSPTDVQVLYAQVGDDYRSIYRTVNGGQQWTKFNTGLEGVTMQMMTLAKTKLYAASTTTLLYQRDLAVLNGGWQARGLPRIPVASTAPTQYGIFIDPDIANRYIVYGDNGLAIALPTPSISSIAPTEAAAQSVPFTLTVNGANFTPAATVLWNGSPRPTTFINESHLSAQINVSDLTAAGSVLVSVGYPAGYYGTQGRSNQIHFSVTATCTVNGTPTTPCQAAIAPNTATTVEHTAPSGAKTTLQIPAGSVATATTLTFTPLSAPTNPTAWAFGGIGFQLEAARNGTALPNFRFEQPIVMTLRYTDADVAQMNEQELRLYYWDAAAWQDAATTCTPPSTYDRKPADNALSVAVCHLTQFALFDPTTPAAPPPTPVTPTPVTPTPVTPTPPQKYGFYIPFAQR